MRERQDEKQDGEKATKGRVVTASVHGPAPGAVLVRPTDGAGGPLSPGPCGDG
jgi:hypothetical protein